MIALGRALPVRIATRLERARGLVRVWPAAATGAASLAPPRSLLAAMDRPAVGDLQPLQIARGLSVVVAGLMVTSSITGLRNAAAYQQEAPVVALFRGYDLVALLVAAPLLIAALQLADRSSARGQLLWLSMLAFIVYDYAYYVLGPTAGTASAAHRILFAAATLALALGLTGIDSRGIAASFSPRLPARTLAMVLFGLGVSLGAMWVALITKSAATGGVLAEPSRLVVPADMTRLGSVLDLTLLVPGYLGAGILLWRGAPWGRVLATVLAVAGTVHQLSYMSALAFQARAGIPGASAFDPAEPPIAAAFAAASAALLFACGREPRKREV